MPSVTFAVWPTGSSGRGIGVHPLDHRDLPIPPPLLQSFLARNRLVDPFVSLVPDQAINPVFRRKAGEHLVLVLPDTAREIARDTEIQRPVKPARGHVDMVRHSHELWLWVPGSASRPRN